MRRASWLIVALLAVGCATAPPARVAPRAATEDDRRLIGRALAPLLFAAGIWRGPQDGCAVGLGILPVKAINLGVAPHPTCKFSLIVTEGALATLPPEELQAALAHELGHVELGHFAARKERREAERESQRQIEERSTTAGAVATAIPIIGPLLALGVAGTQAAAETVTEGTYRSYDQREESAADRYATELLNRLPGTPSRCRFLAALLVRLDRERSTPIWRGWLSTHPSPGTRLEAVKGACA
jgi:Zn-dependent protease with chaperone function